MPQPTCTYMFVHTHRHTHMGTHTSHTSGHTQVDGHIAVATCTDMFVPPYLHTHWDIENTHTYGQTHFTHKRANTLHTHTMHTHFTHKWEHAASFRSICFKAGALSCCGRVCVRMSEFSKFITHSLHDTPRFITILLFPQQVLPFLRNSRVITPNINTQLLQIKKNIWKVRSYLINFRVIRKMVTFFFQTPKLK